ncbi:hypothetical protein [Streptomyces sp. NPDC005322]|uniref:hypothetical protein n=1 Tax=Streptomyces sp. NPDC005322 TaxID=3157032 RepID=UPI0033A142AC
MSQPPPVGNPYGAVPGGSYGPPQPTRTAPAPPPQSQPQSGYAAQPGAHGQPQPGYPAQPGAHGQPQPGYPAQPGAHGQPQPGYPAQPGAHGQYTCRVCNVAGAADVTFRSHQGLLVLMTFRKLPGPFCRTCGTAIFRDMTTRTLWQGWWSPFSAAFFNPFTIIANRVALSKVNKLPDPSHTPSGPRLDPGKPVLQRPASLVALVPVLWVLTLVVMAVAG